MEDYKLARKKHAVDLMRAANRRLERAVKHMEQFDELSAEKLKNITNMIIDLERHVKL